MFGVLLMINDGDFVNVLMYFRYKVEKIYVVKIKGLLIGEKICMLECGVMLEDGKIVLVCVKIIFWDKCKEMVIV